MRYNPALDGLRAIAVAMVVARHAWAPWAKGGFIGVDIFFVLSGFLITRVLMENPSLRRFYIRRVRRLIPALALLLAAYLAVFPLIVDGPHLRDAALAFFYISDFSFAFGQVPKYLGHTWSLSIEEHFYLLWPLVFLRWKPSMTVLAAVYVLITAWRWQHGDWMEGYYRFDMRASGLLLGCMIAQVRNAPEFPAWPGLMFLGVIAVFLQRNDAQGLAMVAVELCAAVAILGRPPAWLGSAPMAYIGKLSYGIYLWHFPLSLLMHERGHSSMAILATTAVFSVAMAALSYHTVEAWAGSRRPKIIEMSRTPA